MPDAQPFAPRPFEAIVADYAAAMSRLARAYLAERGDQEDLVQEIWLALWLGMPRFRGECSERTYVYRVAHNRALTFRSRRRRAGGHVALSGNLADPAVDPAESAAQADLRDQLAEAVRALAEPYREAVVLHLEGLSGAEIAAVQGTTPGNVAVRLTRARDALRRHFAADAGSRP